MYRTKHVLQWALLMSLILLATPPTGGPSAAITGPATPQSQLAYSPPLQGPPDAQSTTGPFPPPELQYQGAEVSPVSPVTLSGVPSYLWQHGCGPTAVGMVVGYWDERGFDALVAGPANAQTASVDQMIASGYDVTDTGTNYSDYCLPLDYYDTPLYPDRSEPPEGDEHPDHCVADFMKTSQSAYSNKYGWSWFTPMSSSFVEYVDWLGRPDYIAATKRYYMSYSPTLTWDLLRSEIDAGRPMVFLVDTGGDDWTDHFVPVIGYDEATHSYGCYDTWDHNVHWYEFAEMAPGQPWGIWGGATFDIAISNPGMKRITRATDDARNSWDPALSATGEVVVFDSDADLLRQSIPDDQNEVWLYSTLSLTYTRVTTGTLDRDSTQATISADGTRIAFQSDADLLGQGVPDDQYEIWLYDTTTMTYTRITTATDASRDSMAPSLSADGTLVAFESDADLLGQGNIGDEQFEVWLYDTTTMTYTRITTATDANRDSWDASLSADGTVVAFSSHDDLLGQGIPQGQFEVWLYNTTTLTYTRITTASEPGRSSGEAAINGTGTLVAFVSNSDLLGQGVSDTQYEIWLYDTTTMTYTRVTWAREDGRYSYDPHLSADGTRVAFDTEADLLEQGIPDGQNEVWVYDVVQDTLTRITWASDVGQTSRRPALSADGETLAFQSVSNILAEEDHGGQLEIWTYHVERAFLPAVLRSYP